jgi:hypothetical protein
MHAAAGVRTFIHALACIRAHEEFRSQVFAKFRVHLAYLCVILNPTETFRFSSFAQGLMHSA